MSDESNRPQYVAPDEDQIKAFARAVCEHYATQQNDTSIKSSEVVNGLARFLGVLLRIEANHRNHLLDTTNGMG